MMERRVKRAPRGLIDVAIRMLVGIALAGSGFALVTSGAAATPDASSARLVHRFLEVVIAPNGTYVASVEGDSPPGGSLLRFANWSCGASRMARKRMSRCHAVACHNAGRARPRGVPTAGN